jgi:hypothetical protein
LVHASQKAFYRYVLVVEGVVPELPVLAVEAMHCASMWKNREIVVAVFSMFLIGVYRVAASGSARANPVANTVCGQRIVVPSQFAFGGGNPFNFALNIFSQPTVTQSLFPDLTPVHTQIARDASRIPGHLSRKPPTGPNPRMNPNGDLKGLFFSIADAIQAQAEFL